MGNERALLAGERNPFKGLGDQLQGVFQSTLLEGSSLAKPGTVQAVVLAASLFFMIDELGDGAE